MRLKKWLLYITNNEETTRHEQEFDIIFFAINTLAVVIGSVYIGYIGEWQWIPFLIIEYVWAVDTIRHNRP